MIEYNILDVVGPLPVTYSSFVVLGARDQSKIFAIQCSYADAEMCHGLLTTSVAVTPYEFLTDVFAAIKAQIKHAELDIIAPCMFGKMYIKVEGQEKLVKIVSSSPCAVLNAARAGGAPIQISEEVDQKLIDMTIEYHRLKAVLGQLFPLPMLDKTDVLRVVSDFVDKIQFTQAVV